jgi:16S rRNA (cytosine1402-N4)-methyltransferase
MATLMKNSNHIPVLLNEVVAHFKDVKLKVFCDCTLGAGSHSKEILKNHEEIETYIGIDQDFSALELAKKNINRKDANLFHDNFSNLDKILDSLNISSVDGFLFDLGVSSMQLNESERGFCFLHEGPLDMRMNKGVELTAEKVVNEFSQKDLEKIFRDYGEEIRWRQAAAKIIEERKKERITNTKQLADILTSCCFRKEKIHPATLCFQGLRIFVNNELESIKIALQKAIDRLSSGGRIAVISFHSLEDRIVKEIFKENSKKTHLNIYRMKKEEIKLKILTKKPLRPTFQEMKENPRSRSGILRVAEKV